MAKVYVISIMTSLSRISCFFMSYRIYLSNFVIWLLIFHCVLTPAERKPIGFFWLLFFSTIRVVECHSMCNTNNHKRGSKTNREIGNVLMPTNHINLPVPMPACIAYNLYLFQFLRSSTTIARANMSRLNRIKHNIDWAASCNIGNNIKCNINIDSTHVHARNSKIIHVFRWRATFCRCVRAFHPLYSCTHSL